MTLNDIALLFSENTGVITILFICIISLIEICPIKINPWSWLGNAINKNVLEKIEKIEKDVTEVKKRGWRKHGRYIPIQNITF